MHQAQKYVDGHIKPTAPQGDKLETVALSAAQATGLRQALATDAADYVYSGAISIGDAVQAIDSARYTWATVKLYYAVFYLARGLLASHGTAIVYDGKKPLSWESAPGTMPTKRNGTTHKAVLSSFVAILPTSPLLSQPIGSAQPLDWLMQRREEVNYKNARFCEPSAPKHFELIAREGVRKSISTYIRDTSYLYTFDLQHAMLAFPIEALKQIIKLCSTIGAGNSFNAEDRRYVASLYFDKKGPLSEVAALFKPP